MGRRFEKVLGRCQALDSWGKQCRKLANRRDQFHGDNEIYGDGPCAGWVLVLLCEIHSHDADVERRTKAREEFQRKLKARPAPEKEKAHE